MYQRFKNLIVFGLIVSSMICGISIAIQKPIDAIKLESLPRTTKGLPLVLKINISGPQRVPLVSIFEDIIPVTVHLKSKLDEKEYVIQSNRNTEIVGRSIDDGGLVDLTDKFFSLSVPEGKKYTMMFDLWSILPRYWTDTCLSDVPAGKYSIYMQFNSENLKSGTCEIELIEPTEKEKEFIKKIQDSGKVNHKDGVDWTKVLKSKINIPNGDLSFLGQVSRDQISFHKLILDVNIADEKSRSKSIESVNSTTLPKYFEPDRQLLLLEVKGNPAKERENFLKQYPELKWKVDELDSGKDIFDIEARTPNKATTKSEVPRRI